MNHRSEILGLVTIIALLQANELAKFSYCFLWFSLWVTLHYLSIPLFNLLSIIYFRRIENSFTIFTATIKKIAEKDNQIKKLINLRRLLRSQIYCILATLSGSYLLFNYYNEWPLSLLHTYNNYTELFVSMAIGHWMWSFFEDEWCGEEVISHTVVFPGQDSNKVFTTHMSGLISHHIVTIFAYLWCLNTQKLGGLCIFGLLFEVPVIIINIRDILACFDEYIHFPYTKYTRTQFKIYSYTLILLFHLTRTLFCLLWPLSLLIWIPQLNTLPLSSHIVYHLLGLIFCMVNYILYTSYFSRYLAEDAVKMGLTREEALWKLFKVPETIIVKALEEKRRLYELSQQQQQQQHNQTQQESVSSINGGTTGGLSNYTTDNKYTMNNINHTHSHSDIEKNDGNINVNSKINTLKIYTLDDISLHNTQHDIWVAISDEVYNITEFITKHPGGQKTLLSVAGKGATDKFLEIGHSPKARKILEKYHIGSLPTSSLATIIKNGSSNNHNNSSSNSIYHQPSLPTTTTNLSTSSSSSSSSSVLHKSNSYNDNTIISSQYIQRGDLHDTTATNTTHGNTSMSSKVSLPATNMIILNKKPQVTIHLNRKQWYEFGHGVLPPDGVYDLFKDYTFDGKGDLCFPPFLSYFLGVLFLSFAYKQKPFFSNVSPTEVARLKLKIYMSYLVNDIALVTVLYYCMTLFVFMTLFSYLCPMSKIVSYSYCRQIYQDFISWNFYIFTILFFVYMFTEMVIVNFAMFHSVNSMYTGIRISMMLTLTIEVFIRKGYTPHGTVLLLAGLCMYDMYTFYTSLQTAYADEMYVMRYIFTILTISGISRSLFVRSLGKITEYRTIMTSIVLISLIIVILRSFHFPASMITLPILVPTDQTDYYGDWKDKYFFTHLTTTCYIIGYILWSYMLYGLHTLIQWSTATFGIQMIVVPTIIITWCMTPPSSHITYYCEAIGILILLQLSYECMQTILKLRESTPSHLLRIKQLEEIYRLFIANSMINLLVKPLINFCSLLAPYNFKFYMYPTPVYDFGTRCDYGIAYQINGNPQQQPVIFQHNVGHFGHSDYDYIRTSSATRMMMEELLDDPEAGEKGFVSDTVAIFPLEKGGAKPAIQHLLDPSYIINPYAYKFREINLSAWSSEKAAHNWYRQSPAHKKIVKDYHSNGLEEFGAMLATLVPSSTRPIRWEVRCRKCYKMNTGPGTGICQYCGDNTLHPLPYL